jgi:hypothetical protein
MLRTIFIVTLCTSLLPTAHSWGTVGHQTVASIAQSLLTPRAAALVDNLLEGATMASVSTWADQVRNLPEWAWSKPLHFADTPDRVCNYNYNRDCIYEGERGMCVTGAIANFTDQLVQSFKNISRVRNLNNTLGVSPTDALKFVIHFVGDSHQPLHTGFLGDLGGNTITVRFFGRSANLHAVWDTNIITELVAQFYNGDNAAWLADLKKKIGPGGEYEEDAQKWAQCADGATQTCISPIAQESVKAACSNAYYCVSQGSNPCVSERVIDNPDLDQEYFDQAYPVVDKRIAAGGVRLATFINYVAEQAAYYKKVL